VHFSSITTQPVLLRSIKYENKSAHSPESGKVWDNSKYLHLMPELRYQCPATRSGRTSCVGWENCTIRCHSIKPFHETLRREVLGSSYIQISYRRSKKKVSSLVKFNPSLDRFLEILSPDTIIMSQSDPLNKA